MANKPEFNSPEEFSPQIRAAFDSYPSPRPDAGFDARFWRELDARKNRYRGLRGLWRRVVEVEIEGVAVWRLGASTLGGSGTFALGFALLGALSAPRAVSSVPLPLPPNSVPSGAPGTAQRFARELLDEAARPVQRVRQKARSQHSTAGGFSCVPFASDLA